MAGKSGLLWRLNFALIAICAVLAAAVFLREPSTDSTEFSSDEQLEQLSSLELQALSSNPGSLELVAQSEIIGAPGLLTSDDVSIIVPANVSVEPITVRVLSPIGLLPYESHGGATVQILHEAAIDAPVEVRWKIADLNERQRQSITMLKWDEINQVWAADRSPYRVVGDQLVAEFSAWSERTWTAPDVSDAPANFSQEVQELFGRRVDRPECDGDIPEWVANFVDPGGVSSAAMLTCIEADPGRSDVVTMRIVNNRTFTQFVTIDEGEFAWLWNGDEEISVTGAIYTSASAVLDVLGGPNRIMVPPLATVAVGVERPARSGANQVIEFNSEVLPLGVALDSAAFALRELDVSGALENPFASIFLELAIDCSLNERSLSDDFDEAVRATTEALKGCVAELDDPNSTLGLLFEERIQRRALDSQTGTGLEATISANRALKHAANALKWLPVFEAVGYGSDLILEHQVGSVEWSISLDGQPERLGAWTATCQDVTADQQAWSRNWTSQPVFHEPPLRDFYEYEQFLSILQQASQPLAGCSTSHIDAVRDLVAEIGLNDSTSTAIAIETLEGMMGNDEPTAPTRQLCEAAIELMISSETLPGAAQAVLVYDTASLFDETEVAVVLTYDDFSHLLVLASTSEGPTVLHEGSDVDLFLELEDHAMRVDFFGTSGCGQSREVWTGGPPERNADSQEKPEPDNGLSGKDTCNGTTTFTAVSASYEFIGCVESDQLYLVVTRSSDQSVEKVPAGFGQGWLQASVGSTDFSIDLGFTNQRRVLITLVGKADPQVEEFESFTFTE